MALFQRGVRRSQREGQLRPSESSVALKLGKPQDWPLEEAKQEWGYEMASYGLGSNSRVRGTRARTLAGWKPRHTSVIDWIRNEMVSAP